MHIYIFHAVDDRRECKHGQIEHRRSTLPSNFEDGVVEILTNINSIKLCLTRWADLSDAYVSRADHTEAVPRFFKLAAKF